MWEEETHWTNFIEDARRENKKRSAVFLSFAAQFW